MILETRTGERMTDRGMCLSVGPDGPPPSLSHANASMYTPHWFTGTPSPGPPPHGSPHPPGGGVSSAPCLPPPPADRLSIDVGADLLEGGGRHPLHRRDLPVHLFVKATAAAAATALNQSTQKSYRRFESSRISKSHKSNGSLKAYQGWLTAAPCRVGDALGGGGRVIPQNLAETKIRRLPRTGAKKELENPYGNCCRGGGDTARRVYPPRDPPRWVEPSAQGLEPSPPPQPN